MNERARVMCAAPACPHYLLTDYKHFDNLSGHYRCTDHRRND